MLQSKLVSQKFLLAIRLERFISASGTIELNLRVGYLQSKHSIFSSLKALPFAVQKLEVKASFMISVSVIMK